VSERLFRVIVDIYMMQNSIYKELVVVRQNRCLLMDETDAPYEADKLPYPRTTQDDLFLLNQLWISEIRLLLRSRKE